MSKAYNLLESTSQYQLLQRVTAYRKEAEREAYKLARVVRSRGTCIVSVNKDGEPYGPFSHEAGVIWKRSLTHLREAIAEVEKDPKVDALFLEGGYDGGDSVYGMLQQDDYTPLVSDWGLLIWKREKGE